MKKLILGLAVMALVTSGLYLIGADHIDAPAVGSLTTGSTAADITDYFAFESPANSDNYVFVCNVLGLSAPGDDITFDEDVMYEINIDNNADNVEDLVIQANFKEGNVIVRGPVAPSATGLSSTIETSGNRVTAPITRIGDNTPSTATSGGVTVFAGPRDDPFFMDFFQFTDIVNGAGDFLGLDVPDPEDDDNMDGTPEYDTAFDMPGVDTFEDLNTLSVVIEVPKSSLGSSAQFSSWVESLNKQ
ncbi:DUF4331 domain-containing protein [Fulvivirga sp. M361]|uniref:DUF4331 family protein n=1 Tax=Fulvivirga sp. M361 TaxID=2594266 RepID=UPI001179C44F|nr:DUF4331 family protein [Fulvivirga sp. M361]TRX56213.1 DUF4331 domain-containing protein [Fulvivirga sp. M361]